MPGETVQTVHVDALLSNLARMYRPTSFIADQVCPYLDVVHESDLYPVFGQGDFYGTDVDDLVPDRAEPRIVEFAHSTETYRTQRRELAWDVSDRERKNADSQFDLERNKQVGTLGRLMLKREIRVEAMLKKTTNGGELTLGAAAQNKWDAAATTTIEDDIYDGREAMRSELVAKLDGVPKHYVVYVLKKDGCVYDFMRIAPDQGDVAGFESFVQGFGTMS